MNHPREPIKHTCADIDKYIRSIKYVMVNNRTLKGLSEQELFDAASSMSYELEQCINYLEELRSSNDILRRWGIEESDTVDKLQEQLEEIESKIPII